MRTDHIPYMEIPGDIISVGWQHLGAATEEDND